MKKVLFLGLLVVCIIFTIAADGFATPYSFDVDNQGWVSFDVTLGSYEQVPSSGSPAS